MRTCARKDCLSEGVWMPILQLRVHRQHPPATAALNLAVCEQHKQTTTVADLVCDKGWEQLCDTFRKIGKEEPRRELTTIYWHKPK